MLRPARLAQTRLSCCLALLLLAAPAPAQPHRGVEPDSSEGPVISSAPELGPLLGRPLRRIDVEQVGGRWQRSPHVTTVRPGERFSPDVARRAARELLDTGRFASASVEAMPDGDGVRLVVRVVSRRIIADVRVTGNAVDIDLVLRSAGIGRGEALTPALLGAVARRVTEEHVRRGYPAARTHVDTLDTDDPLAVVLDITVEPGPLERIVARRLRARPFPPSAELARAVRSYGANRGDAADEAALEAADTELAARLRSAGYYAANVLHELSHTPSGALLSVTVDAGLKVVLTFQGNRRFDDATLEAGLELDERTDRSAPALADALVDYYRRRGFWDVRVDPSNRRLGRVVERRFDIVEGAPVRVVERRYPCLRGERTADDVSAEVDSFLAEELPGATFLGAVSSRDIDAMLDPGRARDARPPPFEPNPYATYDADVYARAVEHLEDLYRSEGYLSASVGPLTLSRRACDARSPGRCVPIGVRARPEVDCRLDPGQPELPSQRTSFCIPDPERGVRCEPDIAMSIPIRLGPRTYLYDVAYSGNHAIVQADLADLSELVLGEPVSQVELRRAGRRILDAYAEEGFAFAEVETELELSEDRTRARAVFSITEREPVTVSRIVIHGAERTSERLILSRVALEAGGRFRRSLVRRTEERLGALGVFSSVSVALEDPYVPARSKVVVVTLQERRPQYLDVRPGFSTGEGFRITFEYGHRNLGGEAVQLTLRSQLGILPTAFILENDVRDKYNELDLGERLERRNSASVELPDIGLGPLFRLNVEGIDVRDNARDFGLTRDAGLGTLIFRPERVLSFQLGGSLELNDATIFGAEQRGALEDYVQRNPQQRNIFRVPEGTTFAIAERVAAIWDRRDNALDATRGTFVSVGVEHVHADPVGEDAAGGGADSVFAATTSDFLRYTNRIAGYVRLNRSGLALAASVRWGWIQQLLANSRTYPDRLFFLGGVDSVRGFLQDSLIPEDIARRLLTDSGLTLTEVVIRGGDAFVNPRLELRIPLGDSVQTAAFVDAGNLWTDPGVVFDTFRLRYAVGSGLRVRTPVGPLAFDYGFNVDRVLDGLVSGRGEQRFWEDIGAFHFSVGLF